MKKSTQEVQKLRDIFKNHGIETNPQEAITGSDLDKYLPLVKNKQQFAKDVARFLEKNVFKNTETISPEKLAEKFKKTRKNKGFEEALSVFKEGLDKLPMDSIEKFVDLLGLMPGEGIIIAEIMEKW